MRENTQEDKPTFVILRPRDSDCTVVSRDKVSYMQQNE